MAIIHQGCILSNLSHLRMHVDHLSSDNQFIFELTVTVGYNYIIKTQIDTFVHMYSLERNTNYIQHNDCPVFRFALNNPKSNTALSV